MTSAARFRCFIDDAVRRARLHGEDGGPTCSFAKVDVLEVRQVAGAHEVGVRRGVEAARLGRLAVCQVRRAARRPKRGVGILRVCDRRHEWPRRSRSSEGVEKRPGAREGVESAGGALGRQCAQRMDIVMLGYDIQGRLLEIGLAGGLASGSLEDGGEHQGR
jgi:hypothetical protein